MSDPQKNQPVQKPQAVPPASTPETAVKTDGKDKQNTEQPKVDGKNKDGSCSK